MTRTVECPNCHEQSLVVQYEAADRTFLEIQSVYCDTLDQREPRCPQYRHGHRSDWVEPTAAQWDAIESALESDPR